MKKMMTMAAVALAVAGMVTTVKAEERSWAWSPLGIGIAAPVQLPYMSSDVYGLRIGGLLGVNNDVYGLDCGLVEVCGGAMRGVQCAGLTWTRGKAIGLQLGALANVDLEDELALQAGFANLDLGENSAGCALGAFNYAISYYGMQAGAVNWNNSTTVGLQLGVANADQEDFDGAAFAGVNFARRVTGVQCGVINLADEVQGLQLGVFNAAERMHGIQIGALNMIVLSKLPVMVVANVMF